MKTIIRNFSHTFRRFLTASLLNIIGLSIAFASFFDRLPAGHIDYHAYRNHTELEECKREPSQQY